MSDHAERLRELSEIKTGMALVMGPGTYQDLWRSDAAALVAGAEALDRMEAIQAERDAARAEAADRRTQAGRAQEALRHLMNGVPTDDAVWAAYGNVDSARAWLAQQRREAAAEALEEFADDAGGMEELIRCNISDLRSALRTRAAALQAGEVGNE